MVTYGGNRPTVSNDEVLTAEKFNDATRFWVTDELPDSGEDGDVVFVIGDSPVGGEELPGIGGWAELKEVSGTFTKHPYGDWVAYEWHDNGFFSIDEGLIDYLVVGGGLYYHTSTPSDTSGGRVSHGIQDFASETFSCEVGKKGMRYTQSTPAEPSYIHDSSYSLVAVAHPGDHFSTSGYDAVPYGAFADLPNGLYYDGYKSSITGTEREYGQGYKRTFPTSDAPGNAGQNAAGAKDGVIIIRLPAANAQNVIENFYRWISYATVENGVVTKVTKTPDNQPYTASAQEVECDASVQKGYLYENGEFTAPEPDYSDEIEALTARLEELRNG
ncbi:MAG: hypothetical protein VW551_05755 [Euryarchaeota archaeon]